MKEEYPINWNFYEIVDGNKETIVDYLDKILNDKTYAEDNYDVDDLW